MRRSILRPSALLLPATAVAAATLLVSGCSCPAPDVEPVSDETRVSYSTNERPMSSFDLVETAVRSGALEYSTGLLYKVYAMFDPNSLPPEYESAVPSKCGTPLIAEVQRNWNLLSPDDRAEISQYIQPIGMPGETGTQLDDVTPDRLDHEREKLN